MANLRHVIDQILGLGIALKDKTIETPLAKSDLEVAIAWLLHGKDG